MARSVRSQTLTKKVDGKVLDNKSYICRKEAAQIQGGNIMVVQHNLTAMNSNRMLGITTSSQAKSTEKLSSGYKINRAADDAAGLSISEKMRKQIRGLSQASLNAEDGISAVQTAEGALTEVHDMLQRMNELAVKAANGTNSEDDRNYIQDEIDQLVTEIDRVSQTTKFNETYMLDGKAGVDATYTVASETIANSLTSLGNLTVTDEGIATVTVDFTADKAFAVTDAEGNAVQDAEGNDLIIKFVTQMPEEADKVDGTSYYTDKEEWLTAVKRAAMVNDDSIKNIDFDEDGNVKVDVFADEKDAANLSLQVGADTTNANKIEMNISHLSARGLGINGLRVDGVNSDNADEAVNTIAAAIQKVSTQRSALGAIQNRLEHTIANLDNVVENTTAAESQIRDTDMATEMVKYANNNILAQAGQSMLAQANQANQGVLSLLQ